MSTNLKHMGGYTYKQLKGKSFIEIQKLLTKEMKRMGVVEYFVIVEELDLGLDVLSFNPSDDPITHLNKAVVFLTTTYTVHFPQTNNQLRTSSNPRNQETIQDGRVTIQTIQGRQTQRYANNRVRNNATTQGVNRNGVVGQARVVKCYNYQEEGHFTRLCTKLKTPKNSAWFKEKALLTEALESRAYLDLEQLAFLTDNEDTIFPNQASQKIPSPVAF
ncbi:hypothetical protein Tco_0505593 [Tanacetum coccineum]